MNIAVTGGRGFLGTHVVEALRTHNVAVTPLSRADGDLKIRGVAQALLQNAEVIIHLAADVGGLGYLRAHPQRAFHHNLDIGLNVIAAATEGKAQLLILAGTPCSYADDCPLPLRETDLETGVPSGDTASYAYAKLAVSKAAATLCPLGGVDVVTVIPSNLYGPHDNFSTHRAHVVAALLRKAVLARKSGVETFEVWGSGSATRDLVFVTDVAEQIATLAVGSRSGYCGQTFNLGSGQETSMRQLASLIAAAVGKVRPVFSESKPVGYTHRVMALEASQNSLGYRNQVSLADGLAATVKWIYEQDLPQKWLGATDDVTDQQAATTLLFPTQSSRHAA